MSTKCLSWGIDQTTGTTGRKAVLMVLCDLADEQMTCYPGREYLAEKTEMSPTNVSKVITQLVEGGFIRVLRRARRSGGRRSNRYLILMYGPDTPLPDVDDWVGEFDPADPATPAQSNGAPTAPLPGGDQETAGQGNGAPEAPMPDGGNSALTTHSTVLSRHPSYKEDLYPLPKTKDLPPPPPNFTHSPHDETSAAAEDDDDDRINQARDVLRQVTHGIDAHRLPTGAERDRLVATVVDLLDTWSVPHLTARLTGMGGLTTVASVYAVLTARLRNVGPAPRPVPLFAEPARPGPWCGACDRTTRRAVDEQDRPAFEVVNGQRRAKYCTACSGHP